MSRPVPIRSLIAGVALLLGATANGLPRSHAAPPHRHQSAETILYSFGANTSDGLNPSGALLPGDRGAFFGTTVNGGTLGLGSVFELRPSGSRYAESINFDFHGSDGAHPYAGLTKTGSRSGVGTTRDGGVYGFGTVFQMSRTKDGPSQRVLYNFRGAKDGAHPYAGIVVAPQGQFFGTTASGGSNRCANGCGIVYRLTPTPSGYSENVVYRFRGGADGANPYAPLLRDKTGAFYGTTYSGGTSNAGTVFKLTPSSRGYTESVLHSFAGGSDGANPMTGLGFGPSGELDGTTTSGGAANDGVMFALVPAGGGYAEAVDWSFDGADGEQPVSALTKTAAGLLAGVSALGGAAGDGVVYGLLRGSSGFQEDVLYMFGGNGDGSDPQGGVVAGPSGMLFGTTYAGGQNGAGTVYAIGAGTAAANAGS